MSGNSIPVIDITGLSDGEPGVLDRVAGQIYDACTEVGFFYVAGHGVPAAVIDRLVGEAGAFFHQPPEIKARTAINRYHRGFSALGDATMYGAARPDYKEFFTVGLELPKSDPDVVAGEPLRGPNNWPTEQPALKSAMADYYAAMGACGATLLGAVAVSLGQSADFFAARYAKRLQRTQAIYYPPQPAALGDDQFGVADHTDFGCITLLWQDDIGGLEVLSRAGDAWVQATPIPGTLVINVGDLLARWTNDRYRSTRHRVVNRSGRERFSIATFYDPSFKAMVDPRDFGVPDAECHYPPVTAGAHILGRINSSFGYRKAVAAS
jgi:isopenicillin N synthase-like dioxygenase